MKKLQLILIAILPFTLFTSELFAQDVPISKGHTELEPGSGIWVNDHFIQAKILESQSKPLEAAAKYVDAANYESNLKNTSWWCYERSLLLSGQIYYDNKQDNGALQVWLPLMDYYYQTKSWDSYISIGQAIAMCYTNLQSYENAINVWWVLKKLVKTYTEENDPNGLTSRGAANKSIGLNFEYWEKYDSAAHYYQRSIELNNRVNNQEETTKVQEYLDRVNKKL